MWASIFPSGGGKIAWGAAGERPWLAPRSYHCWQTFIARVFLKINLKKCPASLKERAYFAYVPSILDYASPICDPNLKKDIHALDRVNCRAARYVIGDYHRLSSVSGMLRSLGWSSLEDWRREARLTLFYKIMKGEIAVLSEDIHLELADQRTRSSHKFKYKTKSASNSNSSNFVTHKTIKDWNSLPGRGLKRLFQVSSRTSEAAGYLRHMRPNYPPPPLDISYYSRRRSTYYPMRLRQENKF